MYGRVTGGTFKNVAGRPLLISIVWREQKAKCMKKISMLKLSRITVDRWKRHKDTRIELAESLASYHSFWVETPTYGNFGFLCATYFYLQWKEKKVWYHYQRDKLVYKSAKIKYNNVLLWLSIFFSPFLLGAKQKGGVQFHTGPSNSYIRQCKRTPRLVGK